MVDFAFTKYLTVLDYTPEEEGAFLVWLLTLHSCSRNAKLSTYNVLNYPLIRGANNFTTTQREFTF